jgi:pimeloyl-ACP methyl ester carboxylesterase
MSLAVIFVHGIAAAASVWQRFPVPGRPVSYISFAHPFGHPAEQAKELKAFIDRTTEDKVILVCHSLGGLAARQYLVDNPTSHKVAKLVLLSVPNLGTRSLAFNWLPWSAAAWAMRPGSRFLRELNAKPLPTNIKYVAVVSNARHWLVRWFSLLLFREAGDGAVGLSSQKLSAKCVPNFASLDYSEINVSWRHFEVPRKAQAEILRALES